jgi:tetratricopeptide (TPR) repeat protein/transcriptional regulator with XRE-family HTH domain
VGADLGQLLRGYRRAAGLTQEELAERSGLSARAIADIECARTKRPYRASVQALADALALSDSQRQLLDRTSRLAADFQGVPEALTPASTEQPPARLTQPERSFPPMTPAADGRVVPRELPAPVAHFIGRAAEMDELSQLAAEGGGRALVICALGGTAGVGKTALAVQWAHDVAQRFPDGQLYVNLRGYDPDQPVAPADALAGLLGTLGVPGTGIPDGAEDRARLYRSMVAGRRVLVLLDNARNSEQVRPLLPGDPGCVAVVTSRDALAGLVATDGARRLDLDVLPLVDAMTLLRSLIGRRADADPVAAATLASLCARLPLALRIAAELTAVRRMAPLADLAAELAVSRLDCLDAGEDRADVRAVFSWSFRQLPEIVAAGFALTSLHPGADLDVYAAAALTGTTTGYASRVLSQLHRASLIQATGPGRYGMHDLLREYAREQAAARDAGGCCDQALTRLFDYYLAAAAAALQIAFPGETYLRQQIRPAVAGLPSLRGEAAARAWLDAERANLVAVVVHCAATGRARHATGLARTLFGYLVIGSHLPEADTIYAHALQAARACGDLAGEAGTLNGLGGIAAMRGRFRDAADHYRAALERFRQCGDRSGQASLLRNLGVTEQELHHYQSAADYYRRAIAAYTDAGDPPGAVAATLCSLAAIETELGRYDQAADHLRTALPVLREAKDWRGECQALTRMGELSLRRGQLTQAADLFEEAMAIYRRIEFRAGEADELCNLGHVSMRQGNYHRAISLLRQALVLHRDCDNQHGEIVTLRALAQALHGVGEPAAARAELTAAVRLAADTGNAYEQASAHNDLAESHRSVGQDEQARHNWQQALALYIQLSAPEADQVRSRLTAREAKVPR